MSGDAGTRRAGDPPARPGRSADGIGDADRAVVAAQLGRPPRAVRAVAHRCPCGNPDVVETSPRLPDGSPFPTLYYLTCPRAARQIGSLEASGLMSEMSARLRREPDLAARYRAAHERYLVQRAEIAHVAEIESISAGGMPDRVKCLHVLIGHALAAGPGVNPLGDEALARLTPWWAAGPCVDPADAGGPIGASERAFDRDPAMATDGATDPPAATAADTAPA